MQEAVRPQQTPVRQVAMQPPKASLPIAGNVLLYMWQHARLSTLAEAGMLLS